MRVQLTLPAALALLTACTDLSVNNPVYGPSAGLRVINGTGGTVSVLIDGVAVTNSLGQATSSGALGLQPGSYTVQVQRSGVPGFPRVIDLVPGDTATLVALDSAGGITPALLADTNAVVPAGASKLRVAHMASSAPPISIWRTQPDFASPTRVQFPFAYRAVSPYLQSTPGDWRVMVSSEDNTSASVPMPDTLANSGLISVATGTSATVVVVDGPNNGFGILVVVP